MEKPIVNLIEDQKVESSDVEITGWEAEQLLIKYGHQPQQFSTREKEPVEQQYLTFEEMVLQEESRIKEEVSRNKNKIYGPKPTTFDGKNGYESEIKYSSDDETGFGFRIEITTDMKLPKY